MYSRKEILFLLNKELDNLNINYNLDYQMLDTLVLDVTRFMDGTITTILNQYKEDEKVKINSHQRDQMRNYLLGYPEEVKTPYKYKKIFESEVDEKVISKAYIMLEEGFVRNKDLMIESLVARIRKNIVGDRKPSVEKYTDYITTLQKDECQLIIIKQKNQSKQAVENLMGMVDYYYSKLSNYHHMIVIFEDNEAKANWKEISKLAIFMENFKREDTFNLYNRTHKKKRIEELRQFLKNHKHVSYDEELDLIVEEFYNSVSYGFHFKDLFITQDGKKQILVMQKIELDERPKKCPSCLQEAVRGNSYAKVLYKSFECTNPSCPSRSKIGRGKRFDLLTSKRQVLLKRNSPNDQVNRSTYMRMRKDIVENSKYLIQDLISLYSWDGDYVMLINTDFEKKLYKNRKIMNVNPKKNYNSKGIDSLAIYKLFTAIYKNIVFDFLPTTSEIKSFEFKQATIINGNSTSLIPQLFGKKRNKISGAVTSPPYYNAREYSQWPNMLLYLIDMMINARAIHLSMREQGVYLYNIGDIVDQDNIYISSTMSKRRQMLGFYSVFVFEIVDFNIVGNVIWDKGEVESKRNSTSNLFSGYLNPVNSYEHCLLFSKDKSQPIVPTVIKKIDPVKKINSKGENLLGHTAPFPEEVPELIISFLAKDSLIVDPYLGSGTSSIVFNRHGLKSFGFEINEKYYNLACTRLVNSDDAHK